MPKHTKWQKCIGKFLGSFMLFYHARLKRQARRQEHEWGTCDESSGLPLFLLVGLSLVMSKLSSGGREYDVESTGEI